MEVLRAHVSCITSACSCRKKRIVVLKNLCDKNDSQLCRASTRLEYWLRSIGIFRHFSHIQSPVFGKFTPPSDECVLFKHFLFFFFYRAFLPRTRNSTFNQSHGLSGRSCGTLSRTDVLVNLNRRHFQLSLKTRFASGFAVNVTRNIHILSIFTDSRCNRSNARFVYWRRRAERVRPEWRAPALNLPHKFRTIIMRFYPFTQFCRTLIRELSFTSLRIRHTIVQGGCCRCNDNAVELSIFRRKLTDRKYIWIIFLFFLLSSADLFYGSDRRSRRRLNGNDRTVWFVAYGCNDKFSTTRWLLWNPFGFLTDYIRVQFGTTNEKPSVEFSNIRRVLRKKKKQTSIQYKTKHTSIVKRLGYESKIELLVAKNYFITIARATPHQVVCGRVQAEVNQYAKVT